MTALSDQIDTIPDPSIRAALTEIFANVLPSMVEALTNKTISSSTIKNDIKAADGTTVLTVGTDGSDASVQADVKAADGTTVLDAGTDGSDAALTGSCSAIATGTPVNAVAATGTLTIDGVVIDGETITIGSNVYEFDTDGAYTGGNIQVDISASATASQGTLTISGVVIDGETVVINSRTYEFDWDSSTTGDVDVDISSYATKSQGTLTFSGVVVHGETLVIDGNTHTFKTDGTAGGGGTIDISASAVNATAVLSFGGDVADTETVTINSRVYEFDTDSTYTGDVQVDVSGGVDKDTAGTALAAAINGDGSADVTASWDGAANELTVTAIKGGTVGNYVTAETTANGSWDGNLTGGTDCTASNAHAATLTDVSEANVTLADGGSDTIVLTAAAYGTAGDSITTTETCSNAAFDAATLGTTTAGADCSAANAVTALVAAINGDGSAVVSAADGVGDTVVVTADTPGTSGDAITTTETMANGAFDAATLGTTTAGVDCTKGNAQTAIITAINAQETDWQLGSFAADAATLTAQTAGVALNSVATTETGANTSWGAASTSGGIDGTVGSQWDVLIDASYIYVCVADNTIADANWERAAISSF